MEQRFGRVIARGTESEIAMVRQALDEAKQGIALPKPYEECLNRDFPISFHSSAEFVDTKRFVPGTRDPAYGYAVWSGLWVNSDKAEDDPELGRHIVLHEIGHVLWPAYLTAEKKAALLRLMRRKDGSVPTSFRGLAWGDYSAYQMRPIEILCDKLAIAVSGKGSPWDAYRFFGLDIPAAALSTMVRICFQMNAVPPPDPLIAELKAQVASLKAELAQPDEHDVVIADLNAQLAGRDAQIKDLMEQNGALMGANAELKPALERWLGKV